jgi:hypothetical protein
MRHENSIFSHLLKIFPRQRFERMVAAHDGDHRVRNLRCWDQFVALLYGQLTGCESLRELEAGFNSHAERHYHLGCHAIKRTTLAVANASRPVALYESAFSWLLGRALAGDAQETREALLLLDSSTMPLNKTLCEWAEFRTEKSGVKLHLAYAPNADVPIFFSITPAKRHDMVEAAAFAIVPKATYVFDRAYNAYSWWQELHEAECRFVCRLKKNARFSFLAWNAPYGEGVLADDVIEMREGGCHTPLRRIVYHCPIRNKRLVFVTNDLKSSALEIADLYKQRWQIELFFKWIKQNLKIKKFLGNSENAVKIQIIIALIAYLILRILQNNLPIIVNLKQLKTLTKANIFQRKTFHTLLKPPDKLRNIRIMAQLELTLC